MNRVTLLQCGTHGPVQSVFEEEFAVPQNNVGEQVAEVGGVLVEKVIEVQHGFGCDQFFEAYLGRCNLGPSALSESVIGVWPAGVHSFENHSCSLNRRA